MARSKNIMTIAQLPHGMIGLKYCTLKHSIKLKPDNLANIKSQIAKMLVAKADGTKTTLPFISGIAEDDSNGFCHQMNLRPQKNEGRKVKAK